jgi:Protein of unknown function (DUF3631)
MTSYHPFEDLEFFLRDHIILRTDADYYAVTVWCAFALAIQEFDYSPRLAFWSPEKRCGKTTILELLHNLLTNSKLTSNISTAALFRTIEKDETCVIIIDEADTIFGRNSDKEKAESLRGIGNAGFNRGGTAIRCVGNSFEPTEFRVFCPVVFAGIGTSSIPETIADRSIMIEMRRKMSQESISEYESDEIEEVFGEIRGRLEKWVEENRHLFRRTKPDFPKELNARARDVWKPLLKIAENIDEEWRLKIFNTAIALSAKEDNPDDISLHLRLLKDCQEVLFQEFTSTKDLVLRLASLEESPWGTMQGFNASLLAKLLRNYGISSYRTSTIRGYKKSDFYDSWNRYIPLNGVTPVIPVTRNDANDANDAYSKATQQSIQYLATINQ